MVCHPDWPATLRRASFRGVSFKIENDDINYGRRIHTWQFPHRDRPYQEDMGEKAVEFSVTAYVASDEVLSEKNALVSACRRSGAGTLVLPTEGSIRVVCFECTRSHEKDRLGFIAFSLHFGEAGAGFGTFNVGLLVREIGGAIKNVVASMQRDFLSNFNVVDEASSVLPVAAQAVRHWVALVDDVRLRTSMDKTSSGELFTALSSLDINAEAYAYDGRGLNTNKATQGAFVPSDLRASGPPSAALVTQMAEIAAALRLGASSEKEAIEALTDLASFEAPVNVAGSGVSASVEKRNVDMISKVARRAALIELSIAAAEVEFDNRQDAIRLRASIAELFDRELSTAKGETFQRLDVIRGKAATAISQKVADLKPAIEVETNASLPSLVWAARLYDDAIKADDLTKRNRVRHPAFMPASFEAEAPGDDDEPKRLFA